MLPCLILCLLPVLQASSEKPAPVPRPAGGPWHAWLDSKGGELPFELEFRQQGEGLAAFLSNGVERLEIAPVRLRGDELTLEFPHYDATLSAQLDASGRRLDGEWRKRRMSDEWAVLPFHASAGQAPRFAPLPAKPGADASAPDAPKVPIDGRWAVHFAVESDPAVGIFARQPDGSVHGTFLTTTGDYRFLAGTFESGRLRLSCFDGAHAFLFDAQLGAGGELAGDFHSGDEWHDTWTAKLDPGAALPDPLGLTQASAFASIDDLSYIGVDGRLYSLVDPVFAGKVRLVQLFGSWCPNCSDEALFLAQLDAKYRERGLSIIGLAFEVSGDLQRDREQVRRFALRHRLDYPLLLAGTADNDQALKAFPVVDELKSWPTTLFLDAWGRPRAVYTGYSGPATGAEHERLREMFVSKIEEMLAEEVPNAFKAWSAISHNAWVHFAGEEGVSYSFARDEEGLPIAKETIYGSSPEVQSEGLLQQSERELPVMLSNQAVNIAGAVWRIEPGTRLLVDPSDCGRRLSPNGMSTTPLLDGPGLRTAERLPTALVDSNPLVRREATMAIALDEREEIRALGRHILPLLKDPSPWVCAHACWAVGELELASAAKGLLANLQHPNPAVRREALRSLLVIDPADEAVVRQLGRLRADPDPLVREAAGGSTGALVEPTGASQPSASQPAASGR